MTWSRRKLVACLKSIIHEEMMPKVTDSELEKFDGPMNEEQMKKLLNFLYEKSDNKLTMYGSVEQIIVDLKLSTRVPESHNYSEYDHFEIGPDCLFTGEIVIFVDTKSKEYVYKQQLLLAFVHFVCERYSSGVALRYAQLWIVEYINCIYREMKGYYEIVPFKFYKTITEQLILANSTISADSPDIVELDDIEDLIKGYCPNFPQYLIDNIMVDLKNEIKDMPLIEKLNYLKSSYGATFKIIETLMYVTNLNQHLFLPFSFPNVLPSHQTATFIFFNEDCGSFAMSKQLDTALRTAFKRKFPEKSYPSELIELETEKEREQGMIFCVTYSKYNDILKTVGLTSDNLNIVVKNTKLTKQITLPFMSPYGTHCKSSETAVREIVTYMMTFMNLFETDNEDSLEKIFYWIDDNLVDLFPERKIAAYVETWKIKAKIDKARKELQIYKPRKVFKMPKKGSYTKNDIIEIVRLTIQPSCFNAALYDLALKSLNWKGDKANLPCEMVELFQAFALNMIITLRCPKVSKMIALQNELRGFAPGPSCSNESQKASSSPKKEPAKMSDPKPLKKGFLNGKRLEKSEVDENANSITNELFDLTANQLVGTSLQTLAHFSNQEYRPFSEFEKVLNDYFRGFFNDKLWNCLQIIIKNKEKLKMLVKCVDHLFDFKFENDPIEFKKKKVYNVDPIQRKLIQEIEDEEREILENELKIDESQKSVDLLKTMKESYVREIEKLKDEIKKLKNQEKDDEDAKKLEKKYSERICSLEEVNENSNKEMMKKDKAIEKLEKELRNDKVKIQRLEEVEKENRTLTETISKLKNEKCKALEESKNKLKELEKTNGSLEEAQKKSQRQISNNQEEIRNLKGNLKNRAGELKKLQDQLDLKIEENQKLSTNLERLNVKFESMQIVEKLKTKKDDLGIVPQLKAENLKIRSMIQENSQQYEELEKWFLSGFDVFQRVQQPQDEVNKRLEKYVKITSIDYDDVLDLLGANLNSLAQVYPNSVEIREAKQKVLDFDASYEDYIKKVRTQIRIIRENPNITIDELGEEIEEFPDKQFMEVYEKWVDDNNLLQ